MSNFPEGLVIGQLLTRELTKEIERRYNTYVELERQLAAKDVEIERLKTVPMRYRRMAFNAQLQDENAQLRQQLAAKQAEIDALMLEYCPNEMSQEQLDNWAAHQRPAKEK